MTLSQIAKEAYVSVSTASKAFSGSPEVNEETRRLIFQVAKKHGCFKKFYNVKYPKLVIGVIAPEFSSMFYTRSLSLIQQNLDHCELCVSTSNFSAERERELIDYYSKHSNADGLIIIDPIAKPEEGIEIPLVLLCGNKNERAVSPAGCTSIYTDGRDVMKEAIHYLKEKGVTSIGFISENHTAHREKHFCSLMEAEGLPVREEYLCCSEKRFEEGGFEAMEILLQRGKPPRAVLCAYDYVAIGAIHSLKNHGFRVPEDVAVLGKDDLAEDPYLDPPLASISSSPEKRCRLAAEAILKRIGGEEPEQEIVIPVSFKLRRSFEID